MSILGHSGRKTRESKVTHTRSVPRLLLSTDNQALGLGHSGPTSRQGNENVNFTKGMRGVTDNLSEVPQVTSVEKVWHSATFRRLLRITGIKYITEVLHAEINFGSDHAASVYHKEVIVLNVT